MATLTTTQIDRLGERLKLDELSEADLRALDDYRRSFATEYGTVLDVIRDRLSLQPTGRMAKSTASSALEDGRRGIGIHAGCDDRGR